MQGTHRRRSLPQTAAVAQELLGRIDKNTEHFGEAAIEAAYLTDEKLDEILTYQTNAFMKFVQSMIDNHFLDLGQINHFLDEFQRMGGYTDAQISALIHDDVEECMHIFVPLKSPRLKEFALTLIQTIRRLIIKSNPFSVKNSKSFFSLSSHSICSLLFSSEQ